MKTKAIYVSEAMYRAIRQVGEKEGFISESGLRALLRGERPELTKHLLSLRRHRKPAKK